jgi:hypothetical protein
MSSIKPKSSYQPDRIRGLDVRPEVIFEKCGIQSVRAICGTINAGTSFGAVVMAPLAVL